MNHKFLWLFWIVVFLLIGNGRSLVWANNLNISNVSLEDRDAVANTAVVEFDISWDNSWRDSTNYDAVWVFLKVCINSCTAYSHGTLLNSGTNPVGMDPGSNTNIDIVIPSDKTGAFLRRKTTGSGTVSSTNVRMTLDYGTSGVADTDTIKVKAFGIEMVYIPLAAFYLGDGNATTESANAFHVTDNTSVQITDASTSSVTVDTNANDDIDTTPIAIDGDAGITGNTSFPTGYTAFYVMKYEITEGQWVAFFNTLSSAQKTTRDITSATGKNSDSTVNRNTISWSSGDATTTRSDRACSYLSWMDGCAFADWAALRPMTELEFEKVARGTSTATVNEYAWGSTTITAAATISGAENGAETITTASANAVYNNTTFSGGDASSGPLRSGIFATASSTRAQSGAGYYGNMELSGNLWERAVTVGNSTGRSFTGTHGDGALTTTTSYEGNATNTDWPGIDGTAARGVTGATGSGYRAGAWSDTTVGRLSVSDRTNAAVTSTSRTNDFGFRAVRTAP
jgi:formylglycine-generating enzyme required for sulfatase activity